MNKADLFNGNIKNEYIGLVKFTLIFAPVILLILGTGLLLIALLVNNVQNGAKIALYIICGLCYVFGLIYPICTIKLIKIYPKRKKIAYLFLQPYVFNEQFLLQEKEITNE